MHRRTTNRRGFTLVEILIVVVIMAILASVVVPQFSASSADAKDARLMHNLQILRKQIELFKTQHGGNAPGWIGPGALFHLAIATNALGNWNVSDVTKPDDQHRNGPYLTVGMMNPFNSGIRFKASSNPAKETPDESLMSGGDPVGWFYDVATGRIAPNAEGKTASGKPRISL